MKTLSQNIEELLSYIKKFKPKQFHVVVIPDFFLDRLISWNGNVRQFSKSIFKVAKRKGGSIDNVVQNDLRGGNAVNTAAALAALGVNVFPIICTSKHGLTLLKPYLQAPYIDLSYVKIKSDPSITTALEFTNGAEKRNVMLRDLGSLKNLSPNSLAEKDYALIKKADYVCVFNWAGTRKCGTELAKTVFNYAKTKGKGITYYDTADPLPNKAKIPELVEKVLLNHNLIDIISLNESEAITYAQHIAPKQAAKLRKNHEPLQTLAKECAKILAQKLTSRVDLHTTNYSATFTKTKKTVARAFKVKTLRTTGAGDAWNAGNIYGDANNFPDGLRLIFANAVAAYYISSQTGEHPQLLQLQNFLQQSLN